MWATLLRLFFTYVVLPLFQDGVLWVIKWFRKKQAEGKTNKEIDDGVDKLENAKSRQEQKDALKEITTGVRRRRASRKL